MNDFLKKLAASLRHLSEDERNEIVQDYREHFEIGLASGKTEQEVAASLGEPEQLALMYAAMGATKKARSSRKLHDAMHMVGAITRYKLGGGMVMGSLYFACLAVLAILFGTAAALAATGVGGVSLAVYEWALGFTAYGFMAMFSSVVLIAGGILGWIGTVRLWKLTIGNLPHIAARIMNDNKEGDKYEDMDYS